MISGEFVFSNWSIAETGRRSSLEGTICQCHMSIADVQRTRLCQSSFGSFSAWKKFVVSQQMPNCFRTFTFDRQNTKQAKAAFKLKNEIVAWGKSMGHRFSTWNLTKRCLQLQRLRFASKLSLSYS